MQFCLIITVAQRRSALLIAIDNINTVCEIGLYVFIVFSNTILTCKHFTHTLTRQGRSIEVRPERCRIGTSQLFIIHKHITS